MTDPATLVDCPQCRSEGYLYSRYIHESPDCDVCCGKGEVPAGFARLYDEPVKRGEDFVDECSVCHTRRVTVPVPVWGEVCAACIVWVVVAMKAAA